MTENRTIVKRYTGGTAAEIIDAMMHALHLHGIDKLPGKGWTVTVNGETTRCKLLHEALTLRINATPPRDLPRAQDG